jgi:hypothetical protein
VRDAVAQRDPSQLPVEARHRKPAPDERQAACEVVVSLVDCTISKRRIPSPAE